MSNLQLIEALCGLLGEMAQIIATQRAALLQLDALAAEDEIEAARKKYIAIIGADEWPDAPEEGGHEDGHANHPCGT